jgi:WD40 repeat protein/serine/threonine protein kinase/tetratricopeptide (TPR) repeat protein
MGDHNPSEADPFGQIADELVEAIRQGQDPSVEELARRYPEHADEIRELLPALILMEKAKAAEDTPGPRRPAAPAALLQQLGDYQILREVGRGGMGVVYEAQQLSLGRHVAIKVLPSHALLDPRQLSRFQREARSAARLHHTNIVPVFGVGEQDGLHYYVMQFIHGLGLDTVLDELRRLRQPFGQPAPTLGETPARVTDATPDVSASDVAHGLLSGSFRKPESAVALTTGPGVLVEESGVQTPNTKGSTSPPIHLPGQTEPSALSESGQQYWQSVARVGMQVADALAHAASQGVLHRDIKPSNLLLDDTGNVWVTDFGLAKAITDGDDLTHTGDIIGTLRYMAPERFNGQGDLRSDIYSLGLTLYELLALRPAFDEADRNQLVRQVMHDEPVRPRKVNPGVPRDLETVVLKAIARDPAQRYQTPAEMAEDLKRFVEDRPVRARPVSSAEKLRRWCRRNLVVAGLAVAVVLALTGGTTVSYLKYLDAEQQKGIAQQQQARAEAEEKAAKEQRKRADHEKGIALQQQARAEAGEKDAKEQRKRADDSAEFARRNLYYAQMHLAPQTWRGGHMSLSHLRELLAGWLPQGELPDRRGWEWFYLNALPYQNLHTLTEGGNIGRASTVAWHVARKQLAEGTAEGLIRIWDVDREQTTRILSGPVPLNHYWGSRWLAWSSDGGQLVAGGKDGTVHVWETASGRELHVLRGHRSQVVSVAFSSDGSRLAAWGENGTIKIWDPHTGRWITDVAHPGLVTAGAWSPDDKLLASGHNDGTVTLSGTQAGDKIVTLKGGFAPITSLAWSPDSAQLASGSSYDYATRIWEVASEKMVLGPLLHSHEVMSVAWEPGGQRLATGSIDETAKIWDAQKGHEIVTLRGNVRAITSLSWGPEGRLALGCDDGSVKVWTAIRDQEWSVLPAHAGRAHAVSWSPGGKQLASGGDDGKVKIWDVATRKLTLTLKAHDERRVNGQYGLIRSLAWSPDGIQLASAGLDGTARVWEVPTGREVFALPENRGSVWSVAWSPDGAHLAVGSEDGTIRVVDGLKNTPRVRVIQAHQSPVRSLAWSSRGDRLASGGWDGLVKLWDPIRGTELASLHGSPNYVQTVAWSPDGKRLASGSIDLLIIVWDAETGRKLATMRGHHGWVESVVWSPDGGRLASAGHDSSVRVWDPGTGEETFVLRGGSGMFHDISWSPDGAQLVAANDDGQLWIWDATRGFERDTTPRALPFIERKVASGAARSEDRLAFAQIALDQKKFALAARLWAEALASDPKRFDDRQMRHRYNAARAGVLAAAGQGREEPPLDDTARAKLRRQALDWLKAERMAWDRLLEASSPQARPDLVERLVRALDDWKQDRDLAGIRDAAALARLPEDERAAFGQLWTDVAELQKKGSSQSGALLQEQLDQIRKELPRESPQLAARLAQIGMRLLQQKKWAEAEPLLRECLAIHDKIGPDHPNTLATINHIGVVYWQMEQFHKSVPLFEELLKRQEAKHGRDHRDTLLAVANLGVNYKDVGRLKEAIALLEEAHRAARKHPDLAWVMNPLLDTYTRAGEHAKFASLLQDQLPAIRSSLPRDSVQLASVLVQIGSALLEQKQWAEAEPLLRECLAIREKQDPEDWKTFSTQSALGGALLGQKRYAEAEPLLLRGYQGMKEREKTIPPQGRDRLTEAVERLMQLCEATDKKEAAAKWRTELHKLRQPAEPEKNR